MVVRSRSLERTIRRSSPSLRVLSKGPTRREFRRSSRDLPSGTGRGNRSCPTGAAERRENSSPEELMGTRCRVAQGMSTDLGTYYREA
jgi:hypothetical protein